MNIHDSDSVFFNVSGSATSKPKPWSPLLIPKEDIDAEILMLADIQLPANGRRSSTIVHPQSKSTGILSLTPATDVTINVLKPGEETLLCRRNVNQIELTVQGSGQITAGETFTVEKHDVWNIPSMRVHSYKNTGKDLWVRITYSNKPLLDKLMVLFEEEGQRIKEEEPEDAGLTTKQLQTFIRENAPDHPIEQNGARLRGYEFLTDIEVVETRSLHWPFKSVKPYLNLTPGDGNRHIWLMYNPSTEKRNGTSNSFLRLGRPKPPEISQFLLAAVTDTLPHQLIITLRVMVRV